MSVANHARGGSGSGHTAGRMLLWAVALIAGSCDRAPQPFPAPAAPRSTGSPTEVIREILRVRAAAKYAALRELVLTDRAEDVTRTLLVVDDFLAANRMLCDQIREKVGPGVSARVDQSHLADHLDVFSRYVELIGEEIEGDDAVVRFMIDGKLPARSARLRRVAGGWRYDPGSGYSDDLIRAFETMTSGLRQLADELRSGTADVAAFRENPDRLVEEVRLRMLPGVKLLPVWGG